MSATLFCCLSMSSLVPHFSYSYAFLSVLIVMHSFVLRILLSPIFNVSSLSCMEWNLIFMYHAFIINPLQVNREVSTAWSSKNWTKSKRRTWETKATKWKGKLNVINSAAPATDHRWHSNFCWNFTLTARSSPCPLWLQIKLHDYNNAHWEA